ncbi:P-loop containing nucleoside triphosphate hydrolases superfamily protein [Wolffia australiana]
MASTPSSRHAKHRLNFTGGRNQLAAMAASPLPANAVPTVHPVEVISRIRDYPERKEKPPSILEIPDNGRSVRVCTDIGYRDFSLDGVSNSADEDLQGFYQRFVESRIKGVKIGNKCTIMMYGPTGAGKSHTMFGSAKEQGIVYRALKDILGESEEGVFVQVAVLEIYNEEIYDLLSVNVAVGALPKGTIPKTRLEVVGKKAKNATYISGNDAGRLSKEVAKVEKRRIVRSTLCNERSSRSHCLIILDVPSVGGRLMLVDMAGSENIEQAGQFGLEAKLQTAKINQGNVALKRVVESIANGDSHVPFRDSKLTMLLQDSFEDDKSKILMILCASPDPAEIHRTISTLEYGAKAKCIVRAANLATPGKPAVEESVSTIAAMNQFILKLQAENKMREKEIKELRSRFEEEIRTQVEERTLFLRGELERMEKKVLQQEEEIEMLRKQKNMDLEMTHDDHDHDHETMTARTTLATVLETEKENEEEEEEEEEGEKKKLRLEIASSERKTRIQNIFRLCGSYREIQGKRKSMEGSSSPALEKMKMTPRSHSLKRLKSGEKENCRPVEEEEEEEEERGKVGKNLRQRNLGHLPFSLLENRLPAGGNSP